MANDNLPTNELNIRQTTDDTVYFYGLDINLTQANLPYVIPSKSEERRLASSRHFVAYGETVTLDGYLANPGKDIRIYARKIIFKNKVIIDNAGPDPDQTTDFDPGVPAAQVDEKPGATGQAGAAGGAGLSAGNVTLLAESFEGIAGKTPGMVRIDGVDLRQSLNDICSAWLMKLKQSSGVDPFVLPELQIAVPSFQFLHHGSLSGSLHIQDLKCNELKNIVLDHAYWDHGIAKTILQLRVTNPSLKGQGLMVLNDKSLPCFPIHFTVPEITLTLTWPIQLYERTILPDKVDIKINRIDFEYNLDQFGFLSMDAAKIKLALDQIPKEVVATTQVELREQLTGIINAVPLPGILETAPDLFIINKGGRGGRGQDGHAGIQGDIGPKGEESDEQVPIPIPPPKSIGGKGLTGGRGGDAGGSGTGAQGGAINIGFIGFAKMTINYDNNGGDGGPAASPGSGGPGGNGGPPGSFLLLFQGDGQLPHYERVPSKPGPMGDPGPVAAFQGAVGNTGVKGPLSVNSPAEPGGRATKPLTYEELAPFMKVEQLLITQRAAEFAFLNAAKAEDYEYVLMLAQWLVRITLPVVKPGFNHPSWDANDIAIAKSIHDNALAMIAHCRQGLDFYGNHTDWAPVLTLDSYQNRIGQLIGLGKIIEDQFRAYQNERATSEEKMAALDEARRRIEADIENDRNDIKNLADQINQMNATIDDLTLQLQQKQGLMLQDETIFKKEFRQYAEGEFGCSFGNILTGATDILKIAGSKGPLDAITGVISLFGDIFNWDAKYHNMLKIIETADANLDDLKNGIAKVKKAIQTPEERGLVATTKQKFDDFIKKFIEKVSTAQELKDAVDQFFDLIDARNQAICNYNALYVKRAKVQADMDQKSSQLQKIAVLRQQQAFDPSLPIYTSFMQHNYANLKTVIVRKLYEEHRALRYWSLKEAPFSTSDLTMATLAVTHSRLSNLIDENKIHRGGPFQPYTEEIRITAADYPLAFRALPGAKKLVFSLPVTLPAFLNQYQVIANEFKLEFPDIKRNSGVLFLTLIHTGFSYQLPSTGEPVFQFVHLPRVVSYKIDYADPRNTGGGQIGSEKEGYIGLSPFATWILNFDHPGNDFLDLKLIQSMVITFTGTFIGPQYLSSNENNDGSH